MRNAHAMLLGLSLLGAAAITAGCGVAGSEGSPVGSSQARLVLSSQGSSSATLRVIATADASSSAAFDRTITVDGGASTVVDVTLAPAGYTFTVDLLGGASGDGTLGSSSAHADLRVGETTQIQLTASAAGGSDGSATVKVGVDAVPQIQGIEVHMTGSGADATAEIHVDATDAEGDALAFFWSGAGIQGAVQGSATLSLSAAAIAASPGAPVVHVVVQDSKGAAATADVTLTVSGGGVQGSMSSGPDAQPPAQACLDAQAQCNASCSIGLGLGTGITLDATCVAACGLAFASCCASH